MAVIDGVIMKGRCIIIPEVLKPQALDQLHINHMGIEKNYWCVSPYTGGSRLSHTAVKPDSCLARIFVAKFFCIIKLIIVIG